MGFEVEGTGSHTFSASLKFLSRKSVLKGPVPSCQVWWGSDFTV